METAQIFVLVSSRSSAAAEHIVAPSQHSKLLFAREPEYSNTSRCASQKPSILESVFPVMYPIKLVRTQVRVHSWIRETLDAYRLHDVQQLSTLNPRQQSSSHVGLLFTLYGLVVYWGLYGG